MSVWGRQLFAIKSRVEQCLELVCSEGDGSSRAREDSCTHGNAASPPQPAEVSGADPGRVGGILEGVQTSLDEVLHLFRHAKVVISKLTYAMPYVARAVITGYSMWST